MDDIRHDIYIYIYVYIHIYRNGWYNNIYIYDIIDGYSDIRWESFIMDDIGNNRMIKWDT